MRSRLEVLQEPAAAPTSAPGVDLSVIVPVSERPEDLRALFEEYSPPLLALDLDLEFVFVLEPHFRRLAGPLVAALDGKVPVRVLVAGQTLGESALVKLGLGHSRGRTILMLPAYHRIQADAFPALIQQVEAGADMVVARRWPRRDSWVNRLQHGALHVLVGRLGGGRIRDTACGVQVLRREVLEEVPLYGDLYRFLPLIAHREGFKVLESDAPQHRADLGTRIYAPGVYLRRLIDLLGLYFLLRFTDKPLRFFGLAGSIVSLAGAAVLALLLLQRLAGEGIADRPLLVLGVMLVVVGVQGIALGLIGEIIVHLGAGSRRPYRLAQAETVSHDGAHPVLPQAAGDLEAEEGKGAGEFAEARRAVLETPKPVAHGGERG